MGKRKLVKQLPYVLRRRKVAGEGCLDSAQTAAVAGPSSKKPSLASQTPCLTVTVSRIRPDDIAACCAAPVTSSYIGDKLPGCFLVELLGYLNWKDRIRCERVCKRWRYLLRSQIWTDVEELTIPEDLQRRLSKDQVSGPEARGLLERIGPNLRTVQLSVSSSEMAESVLEPIAVGCSKLRRLGISTSVCGDLISRCLKSYSLRLAHIREFSLEYDNPFHGLNSGLRALSRTLVNLRSLDLQLTNMPPLASQMLPNAPELAQLVIVQTQPDWLPQRTALYTESEFALNLLDCIGSQYARLRDLCLSLDIVGRIDEERALALLSKLGRRTQLESLSLRLAYVTDERWFGTQALNALMDFNRLKRLSLWLCALPRAFPDILDSIGANLKHLKLAITRGLSDQLLGHVFQCVPNLEEFSLIFSTKGRMPCPSDVTIRSVELALLRCKRLSLLELFDCDTIQVEELACLLHSVLHRPLGNSTAKALLEGRSRKVECLHRTTMPSRLRNLMSRPELCCTAMERRSEVLVYIAIPRICCQGFE